MLKEKIIEQSGEFKIGGDLPVYRLGFGAMRITGKGIWGAPSNIQESKEVLKKALELGINLIDTADSYGPEVSENLIAETLSPYPKGLVIATKGGLTRPGPDQWVENGKPEYLEKCILNSLKRLKINCIDLYQLHRIDSKVPMEESLGVLKKFQAQGKIRHIGLSEVSVAQIERARKFVPIVTVQNLYNVENRQSEEVLNYCEKHKLGFIPWFPIASGDLAKNGGKLSSIAKEIGATPAQVALAWLLKRSPVMLPIPGTGSVKHLEENCEAASIQLSDKDYKDLLNNH